MHIASFEALIKLAQENRDIQLRLALERDVRLVRFEQGSLEFSLTPGASPQLAQNLMRRLQEWTGERWLIAAQGGGGAESAWEKEKREQREVRVEIEQDPFVQSVMAAFPGAEIIGIRNLTQPEPVEAAAEPPVETDDDED